MTSIPRPGYQATIESKMASLAEQLRALSNPEPSRIDLDEDEFDVTRAQTIKKAIDSEDFEDQEAPVVNNLRKKTATLLQDVDKKYAGHKISRAQLEVSRGHDAGSDEDEEHDEEEESEIDSAGNKKTLCGSHCSENLISCGRLVLRCSLNEHVHT